MPTHSPSALAEPLPILAASSASDQAASRSVRPASKTPPASRSLIQTRTGSSPQPASYQSLPATRSPLTAASSEQNRSSTTAASSSSPPAEFKTKPPSRS